MLALGGQIMDASVMEAPRQRNTQEEKETIKSGETPKEWKSKPSKMAQKDTDARWTMKRGRKKESMSQRMVPAFGHKSYINIDKRHGLIRSWTVTHAATYDGARLPDLLQPRNCASDLWADSVYKSHKNESPA